MLSRVLPLENLHRIKGGATLEMYDDWEKAPDWIIGYWPKVDNRDDALDVYNHLSVWRRRAMPSTLIWLWIPQLQADAMKMLAEGCDFYVLPAPVSISSEQSLLQCTIPWGIRTSRTGLVNPISWVQTEISRFCQLHPEDPATRELKELINTPFHNDYLNYLPERMDEVVKYITAAAPDQDFFHFRSGAWNSAQWKGIWNRIRDAARSLSFWGGMAITPSDLGPDSNMDADRSIYYHQSWWEQLVEPPQVVWSPWNFHAPAATAALERSAEYFSATWKPLQQRNPNLS